MEAKKPHHPPSTSWRTRKSSSKIRSESKGLSSGGADGVGPGLNLRAQDGRSAPVRGQEKTGVGKSGDSAFALPLPLCSVWSLNGLEDAHSA